MTDGLGVLESRLYSVVVVGDHNVGKTSFVNQLQGKEFDEHQEITLGIDYSISEIVVSGTILRFRIGDLAGQSNFATFRSKYVRNVDLAILVFDLFSPMSLQNLQGWYEEIKTSNHEKLPSLLIGNKLDLERKVTRNHVRQFNNLLGNRRSEGFVEISARTGEGMDTCVNTIVTILSNS